MNFQDVLNAVIADGSAYAAAKKMNIAPQMFYQYQNGKKSPSDKILDKMVDLSGLSVKQVYLAAYAEKVHNAEAAEVFRHLAA